MLEKRFNHLETPLISQYEDYLPTAFSGELTLLQKVNKIIQDLKRSFDLTNEMVDYLNKFIETFDEKLYLTMEDILNKWLEDGTLSTIIYGAILKIGDLSIFRSFDKTIMEKMKNEFVERGINVRWFGAKGDGLTDDWQSITNAAIEAREKNLPLMLNGVHYVSKTVDFSGLKLVYGNGSSDPSYWDSRIYQGNPVGNGWVSDNPPPFSFFIEGLSGDCIVSDVATPIVTSANGNLSLKGIGIYGSFNNIYQVGFMDSMKNPTEYNGTIKNFENVKIRFCGGHGIWLKRGLEYGYWRDVRCDNNGGHGLFIDRSFFRNNPCEYSIFTECSFDNNYLQGVYLKGLRKAIVFNTCNFSRSGQYQLEKSNIRNRTYPINFADVKSGIKCEAYNGIAGASLTLNSCYAEDCQLMLHLDGSGQGESLNNIRVVGCTQQPIQYTPEQNTWTKAMVMFDGGWIHYVDFINNVGSNNIIGLYNLTTNYLGDLRIFGELKSTFNIPDSAFDLVVTGLEVKNDLLVNHNLNVKNNVVIDETLDVKKDVTIHKNLFLEEGTKIHNPSSILKKSSGVKSVNWSDTFSVDNLFTGSGSNKGVGVIVLLLNSNFQATNNNKQGSYLCVVQKGYDGTYKMNTIAFSSVDGFLSVPSINNSGVISLGFEAYYQYTITKLDMNYLIDLAK